MSITATDPNFGTWVIAKERGNKVRRRQIGTGIWTDWESKPVSRYAERVELFSALTRDHLRVEAKLAGLKGYGNLTKAGLVDLLAKHQ
ncbi:hypothetical protein SEA_JONJAMES_187 [Gordonia Phage JonJames]|nr:hypothetical protein SEA_JONJAMES_187 [Gordonia Phage JonJames]